MSNPKTAIQEIKNLMVKFGFMSNEEVKEEEVKEEIVETVESNFAEAKLVDGTVVKVEGDLVEGAAVKVVTEEAEIPAPDGVHELEDGTKVETKDGVIVKVEKAEVEEPEAEVEIEVKKEDEMYSLLKELMEKISDKMKKMEDKMSSIESDFNSFKKEPAAKKINSGKTDFGKVDNEDSLDSRINAILAMRQSNKK